VNVALKDDIFPSSKVGYSKLVYLNFSTREKANQAKSKLQYMNASNLQGRYSQLIDLENFQVFLKSTERKSVAFSIWIKEVADADAADLKETFLKYGNFASGFLPVKQTLSQSAIVNFARFEDARSALDACKQRKVILGRQARVVAEARPQFTTEFILRLIQRFQLGDPGAAPVISMRSAEELAGDVAAECGVQPSDQWLSALMLCPAIFRVDDHRIRILPHPAPHSPAIVPPQPLLDLR
jgi:hypothetical protein